MVRLSTRDYNLLVREVFNALYKAFFSGTYNVKILTKQRGRCRTKRATSAARARRRRCALRCGRRARGGRATDPTARRTRAACDTHCRRCRGADCSSSNVCNKGQLLLTCY